MNNRMGRASPYDMGNSSQTRRPAVYLLAAFIGVLLFVFAVPSLSRFASTPAIRGGIISPKDVTDVPNEYRVMVIADLDKKSRGEKGKVFRSILLEGALKRDTEDGTFSIKWGKEHALYSGHNEAGRGMELSELVDFQGHLVTADDRTGMVFEVVKSADGVYSVAPRHVLGEGDGSVDKGMKIEWATVKDNELVLGSFGKEYTDEKGAIISTANNWIVTLDAEGRQKRYDWTQHYAAMRAATGTGYPGYMIHEAGNWSPHMKRWVFLPRRVSVDPYDDVADELKGSNKILLLDETLTQVEVREAGTVTPERGFSSFKFLPGTRDTVIIALKSEEKSVADSQNAFLTVFDLDGQVLLQESEIPGAAKFEGLEVWQGTW